MESTTPQQRWLARASLASAAASVVVLAVFAGLRTIPLLGVHPTLQGLGAQVAALALVLIGVWMARRAPAR